ncbi:MAG TPA: adenylate/guanylate cyclase domain-containing protein, partial [Nitrososphaerales archaeon]|nr:adenylate/guanylate cyclase domain-containing protein [Nitrososphaerales archaeon]
MTESERRLAAIMFTDIVGYTSLTQDNEEGTMASLREHREVLRPVFERRGGREVKTIGDAFLVEFASSLEAVRCALEIQGSRSLVPGQSLKVRIGIHVGEVIHEGGDVYGDAVNIAARIEPLAEPGGICISRQVFDFVQKKVDAKLIRVGLIELKNVKAPMEIYRVLPSHSPGAEQMSESLRMRVAVLPFDNFSPEAGDEYFADGLTEEMIGTLSKIRELNVISRTSVMQYKGKPRPISDIGKELNAGTILEGSVRKVGNRARVSIQLIDATEDRHVWAENYDRDLTDIFAVQSDIAGKVADALKVELLADERKEIGEAPTKNVEANLLFLKGLYEIDKGSQSNMMKGIDYFKQAVGKDPKFALAYSFIGSSYIALGGEILPAEEAFPKAKESIETALKLDPKLAQAHAAKGWAAFQYDWDFIAAEGSLRTAIDLSPNLASALHFYGRVLASLGRFDEAISEMTRAFELDPAATWVIDHYGTVYYMAKRYREAREMFDRVLRHNPTFVKARMGLAFVDVAEGNREAAKIGADDAVA